MSDYIDRKRAADFLCKIICGSDRGLCVSTPENCQQRRMLEFFELPTADVTPVVRCIACKHGIPLQHSDYVGCKIKGRMLKDGFCSCGERITE